MRQQRRRRWPYFAAMAVLGAIAFPWYREPGATPQIWWGLPDWAVVAGLCFLGVACLNAAAWWRSDWNDDTPDTAPARSVASEAVRTPSDPP